MLSGTLKADSVATCRQVLACRNVTGRFIGINDVATARLSAACAPTSDAKQQRCHWTCAENNAAVARLVAMICLGGAFWAVACIHAIYAAEIGTLAVSNNADTYCISFDAPAEAPAQTFYEQLPDYAHFSRLSSVMTSIPVEPAADGGVSAIERRSARAIASAGGVST